MNSGPEAAASWSTSRPLRARTSQDGAAFYIERSGNPRISSVEFSNFCIDGLHFTSDGSELPPENTYVNGKTGIYVADANDAFRINGMGFVYLEHALTIYNADALSIHDNFIAECGSCIELRGWGQASKITDNLIGAGFKGHSIHAENHGGLLITANNVFPRGASSVHLDRVTRSSLTNNRLHSFYPGMVVLTGNSSENLIAANHFLRDLDPWTPFQGVDNGLGRPVRAPSHQRTQQLRDRKSLLRSSGHGPHSPAGRNASHHPTGGGQWKPHRQQPRGRTRRPRPVRRLSLLRPGGSTAHDRGPGALAVTAVMRRSRIGPQHDPRLRARRGDRRAPGCQRRQSHPDGRSMMARAASPGQHSTSRPRPAGSTTPTGSPTATADTTSSTSTSPTRPSGSRTATGAMLVARISSRCASSRSRSRPARGTTASGPVRW